MLAAANAIVGVGLIWLSEKRLGACTEREREKRTRLFQSKVLEARGVNALEVALVGICARVMCGATISARDTRRMDMGIGKAKSTDELGGGKGQGADRSLAHGFYEQAKIQQTWTAKDSQRDTSSRAPRSMSDPISYPATRRSSQRGRSTAADNTVRATLQWTEDRHSVFPSLWVNGQEINKPVVTRGALLARIAIASVSGSAPTPSMVTTKLCHTTADRRS